MGFTSFHMSADVAIEAPAQGWADRSDRLTTMLMAGRLVTDAADYLCRVRNVSAGGMMVECDAGLTVGDAVRVELRNLAEASATIVWVRTPRAGLKFDAPADVAALVHGVTGQRMRPRAPRLTAHCPMTLMLEGRPHGVTLRDISQSGCRVESRSPLPLGGEVRVDLPGLSPHLAIVKWVRGGEVGLNFRSLLSFAELASWQRDGARRFASRT